MKSINVFIALCVGISMNLLSIPMAIGQYSSYTDVLDSLSEIDDAGGNAITLSLVKINGSFVYTENRDGIFRNIHVLEISKGGKINILIIASLHAREIVSTVAALKTGEYISRFLNDATLENATEEWDSDSRFTYFRKFKEMNILRLVEMTSIKIIPISNPDGYCYVMDKNPPEYWRKNRRYNISDPVPSGVTPPNNLPDSEYTGVDLNRNFTTNDAGTEVQDADGYPITSRRKWSNTYCGRPLSNIWSANGPQALIKEREVLAIEEIGKQVKLSCVIDLHSYAGTVGWVERPLETSNLRPNSGLNDQLIFGSLGAKGASLIKDPGGEYYVPEITPYKDNSNNIIPTTGDSLAWIYEKEKCLAFLIEIGKEVQLPQNPDEHADAVLPGVLFMMFCAADNSFSSKPVLKFKKPNAK